MDKIKELENRVKKLELENELDFGTVLVFYLTMPIWLPIHLIMFVFNQLGKPLRIYNKEIRNNKKYFIKGEYNPCEYVWSILSVE